MRILCTGSRGFVGSATVPVLEEAGHTVIHYDLMDNYDITDTDQLMKVCEAEKPDRILHLAAVARFSEADANPELAHEVNVIGSMRVATVACKYHIPVVYASTGSCYMPIELEPPITEDFPVRGNSVYGVTKALGEKYIQKFTTHIILRYAHLYGREKRHHGLVGGFVARIERGLAPKLYNGAQSNDFCYIRDVARANLLALEAPWDSWNQCYNVGTGTELSAEEAGKAITKAIGYTGGIEKLKARTVDPLRFVYDISKAKRMLNWEPEYTFDKGLKEMFKK